MNPRENRVEGATLVEAVMALIALALLSAVSRELLLNASIQLDNLSSSADSTLQLKTTLSVLERDLRSACLAEDRSEASLVSHRAPDADRFSSLSVRTGRWDDAQNSTEVQYGVEKDATTGQWNLWRSTNKGQGSIEKLEEKKTCLIESVTAFELRFFQSGGWQSSWCWNAQNQEPTRGIRGLPLAVEISIRTVDQHHVIRLVPIMIAILNQHLHV